MKFPYNVMRHADWDFAPRDPISIGASIAVSVGVTSTVGTLLIQAATYVAISAVTSWAISALAPKPDFSSANSGGILVNNRGSAEPQEFVYGQIRKGGTVVYDETTGTNNKFLHRVIALAGHEVEEIGDIYIDDEIVSVAPSTGLVGGKWENKIRINKHLGDQTSADDDLLSESEQIDSNFVGRGIAYIYVRFAYDQDVFANGLPLITAVVKGKKVYDPRTDSTAYTNNAALCLRDYLVSEYGLNDDDIDDVAFQAAANECDVDVDLAGGGTEKKYTMDGRITADSNHGETLQRMVTCCAGTLFWGMGKWKLVAGAYSAPVKTLTEGDLRGPISVQPRVNIRDNFNTVRGTFNDADEDWITVDYPQVTSSVFKAEDGGDELPLDLELPFTTSPATAQRLAKLTLHRAREQIRVDADFSLDAFDVQVGDIISFSFERYGWTQKEFEVVGWKMSTGENGAPRVRLSLQETSEEAFDWNAEETAIIANNSSLLSPFEVPIPALNAAVIGTTVNNDGTTVPQIGFSWSVTEGELVDDFDFQWKLSTESDWNSTTTRANEFYLASALSGAAYDYRVRAVNGFGVKSPFATSVSPASTGDDGTTPNAPSNVTASGGQGAVQLSWDAPTQNTDGSTVKDLFQYKVYRNGSNNFGTASLVGRVAADSFAESALSDETTYYYWVTALDYTGNESAESAVASATTSAGAETRGGGTYYIGVASLPTTSSGAHTDFTSAVGDPVDFDRAWFYTGTLANPTAQSVWVYEEGSGATPADSWNEQEEVIDGDLLVTGTVTADKVSTSAITTDKLASNSVSSLKIASSIESDNFVTGEDGWSISRATGSAEFNDIAVRGDVINLNEKFEIGISGNWYRFLDVGTNKDITDILDQLGGAGTYAFILVGAGGGGADGDYNPDNNREDIATGGGAGALANFVYEWNGSTPLTADIGAGGSPSSAGGTSRFKINGTTRASATGGAGGSQNAQNTSASGGSGGNASINTSFFPIHSRIVDGSRGGNISSAKASATGGGGIDAFDLSRSTPQGGDTGGDFRVTPGGGVWGGGNASTSSFGDRVYGATIYKPASTSNFTQDVLGGGLLSDFGVQDLIGGYGSRENAPGSTSFAEAGTGGLFSGGGGLFNAFTRSDDDGGRGGDGGIGGGGGGCVADSAREGGSGGNGALFISRIS